MQQHERWTRKHWITQLESDCIIIYVNETNYATHICILNSEQRVARNINKENWRLHQPWARLPGGERLAFFAHISCVGPIIYVYHCVYVWQCLVHRTLVCVWRWCLARQWLCTGQASPRHVDRAPQPRSTRSKQSYYFFTHIIFRLSKKYCMSRK